MAGDAVVGALRVVLGMDTATFEDGAKRAADKASAFGTQLKAVFGGVGLERIFENVTHALKELVKHSFESIDVLGKQAQKVGLTVEEFSALNVAASLADVSMESLSTGLGKLSKNMVEAAAGTGEAQSTFERLGISVRKADGTLRPVSEVLADIADKFQGASDGAVKTAASMALFGKSGKELIVFLNDGSSGLKEMSEIAERMGLVISGPTFNAVQKFNDNLKLLKLAGEGFANLVVADIIPALVGLSEQFVSTAKQGDGIRDAAKRTSEALIELIVVINQTLAVNVVLGTALKELQEIFVNFPTGIERSSEAYNNLLEIIGKLPEIFKNARQQVEGWLKITIPARATTEELALSTGKFNQELQKLALQAREIGGEFAGTLAPGFIQAAISLKLINEDFSNLDKVLSLSTDKGRALNDALIRVAGAKLTDEFQAPWDKYEGSLKRINLLLSTDHPISAEIARAASVKAATDMVAAYGQGWQTIASNGANAFKTLAEGNKKYAGLAKAAAIGEATVNTFVAATKALTLGPILGPIAAAAITAAGLATVAKISATEFAQGGSFKVGGVGGIDSQTIAMNLTPGEMVDVRKPGQTTTTQEITVNMRGRDLISKDMVRDLFAALNEGTRDGYRLKMAEG